MLDLFVVLSRTGVTLWSKQFTDSVSKHTIVNKVVRTAFLEERTATRRMDMEGYTIRWSFNNALDLTFIVAYQRILQLGYIEDFLETVQDAFTVRYGELLRTLPTATTSKPTLEAYANSLKAWDAEFVKMLRNAENNDRRHSVEPRVNVHELVQEENDFSTQTPTRGIEALRGKAASGPGGRRIAPKAKKNKTTPTKEPTPTPMPDSAKKGGKERRKWGASATADPDTVAALDYSGSVDDAQGPGLHELIDETKLGHTREDGMYELADDAPDTLPAEDESHAGIFGKLLNAKSGTFSLGRLTGAKDAITQADLEPVLQTMQLQLQSKNVANEVAEMICDGVKRRLYGKRVGNFGSIKAEVRKSMEDSITRILTPSTSTDILLDIASKKRRRDELLGTNPGAARAGKGAAVSPALNPYTISFVGVNGVGKSTNLAKVCFWLLQNRYRVLIAACDTFRSGAVEQLRTHVRNLGQLEIDGSRVKDGMPTSGDAILELYERGYGKDAAGIAKDALAYARTQKFDVVLIDTAGRMQDNEPLMRALAKLIAVNQPDKVLFVGEALVGNEAVDQLTKFNRALKDYSGVSNPHGLDGCLLTKWDTVDDKVGTALTSAYATGLPIFFVGTGQTYTDLRQLRVAHVVDALLRT